MYLICGMRSVSIIQVFFTFDLTAFLGNLALCRFFSKHLALREFDQSSFVSVVIYGLQKSKLLKRASLELAIPHKADLPMVPGRSLVLAGRFAPSLLLSHSLHLLLTYSSATPAS